MGCSPVRKCEHPEDFENEAGQIANILNNSAQLQAKNKIQDSAAALACIAACLQRILGLMHRVKEYQSRSQSHNSLIARAEESDILFGRASDHDPNEDEILNNQLQKIRDGVTEVEQAVNNGRNNCMKLALTISDAYTSRVLPLERGIAQVQEKTRQQIQSTNTSISQNQNEAALLRWQGAAAVESLQALPIEAVRAKVAESRPQLENSVVAFGMSSGAFAAAIFFPPMFVPAIALSIIGLFESSPARKALKEAERLIKRIEALESEINTKALAILALGFEKTRLERQGVALEMAASSLSAAAARAQTTRADSQKLEACCAEEQSLLNRLMISVGKLKYMAPDMSGGSCLESLIFEATQLADGLFSLARALHTSCPPDENVSRWYSTCISIYRHLARCVRPLSKPAYELLREQLSWCAIFKTHVEGFTATVWKICALVGL